MSIVCPKHTGNSSVCLQVRLKLNGDEFDLKVTKRGEHCHIFVYGYDHVYVYNVDAVSTLYTSTSGYGVYFAEHPDYRTIFQL